MSAPKLPGPLIRFGLVTEGKTDVEPVQTLVREHLRGLGISAEFDRLQPALDETTGEYSQGGWGHIMQWCRDYPLQERATMFLEPLFDGIPARCDMILVQMDGDIVVRIAAEQRIPIKAVTSPLTMFAAVQKVLACWLGASARKSCPQEVTLPAIQSTETWIVAGAMPSLADPEKHDPVPLLLSIHPELECADHHEKLNKTPAVWRSLNDTYVVKNVANIVDRCPLLAEGLRGVERAALNL